MNELTPDEHRILVDAIQDSATVIHKGRMMNEQIRELAEQAGAVYSNDHAVSLLDDEIEKFAELIVKECIWALWTEECRTSDLASEEYTRGSNKIKQHFGVE